MDAKKSFSKLEVKLWRLAQACCKEHPDFLNPNLTYKQLLEREAFEEQYGYRDDVNWGFQNSIIYNMNRNPKAKALKMTKLMPYYKPLKSSELMSPDAVEAWAMK